MPKKSTIVIIILAIITGLLIFYSMTVQVTQEKTQPKKNTSEQIEAQKTAHLFFNPTQLEVLKTSSAAASVDVMLDTGNNTVSSIQLELRFNPLMITPIDMVIAKDGLFGPDVFQISRDIDTANGRISLLLGVPEVAKAKKGKGKVASLLFVPRYTGAEVATIDFIEKSMVLPPGSSTSVLANTTPLMVLFQ